MTGLADTNTDTNTHAQTSESRPTCQTSHLTFIQSPFNLISRQIQNLHPTLPEPASQSTPSQ